MSDQKETPEETKARERDYLVRWMRGVIAEKPDISQQKAFMAKVDSVASHHGITLEELLAPADDDE
ncbi:hypothetical protein LJC36_01275 [Desulfovibrio sp. OttesenSCG-928-C14]|nr:hypothetical protein [Desulfovibrio sp. OttesenSCG-928-C14]